MFLSVVSVKELHLNKKHQIYCLEKLNGRELYNIELLLKAEKPNAQKNFDKNPELEWKYRDV